MDPNIFGRHGSLGTFIPAEYEVARCFLGYLSLSDLNTLELVDEAWRKVAQEEKERRSRVVWYSFSNTTLDADTWGTFMRRICPASMCLWFSHLHYGDANTPCITNFRDFRATFEGDLHENVRKLTTNIIRCPLVSMTATITSMSEWTSTAIRRPAISSQASQASSFNLEASEASGTTYQESQTSPSNSQPGQALTSCAQARPAPAPNVDRFITHILLLPVCPGVQVSTIKLSLRNYRRFKAASRTSKEHIVQTMIGVPSSPVQCLLLFHSTAVVQLTAKMLARAYQGRQQERIAVGGTSASCSMLGGDREVFLAVVVKGENVSASSLFIADDPIRSASAEGIDEKMSRFREGTVVGRHNVGMLFHSFCDVGAMDVCMSAFRRHFPGTPLCEIAENSVVGWTCLRVEQSAVRQTDDMNSNAIGHHNTGAVFVHLALRSRY